MPAPNGCDGSCCAAFYIPTHKDDFAKVIPETPDDITIRHMLIPLTRVEVRDRREQFGIDFGLPPKNTAGHWYKCRHWNEETRLCGIYEQRPKMCRDFPYEKKCEYGCSYRPPRDIVQEYIAERLKDKARPR